MGIGTTTQTVPGFSQQNFPNGGVEPWWAFGGGSDQVKNTFSYVDNVSYQHGRHLFKAGVQFSAISRTTSSSTGGLLGSFGFTGVYTSNPKVGAGNAPPPPARRDMERQTGYWMSAERGVWHGPKDRGRGNGAMPTTSRTTGDFVPGSLSIWASATNTTSRSTRLTTRRRIRGPIRREGWLHDADGRPERSQPRSLQPDLSRYFAAFRIRLSGQAVWLVLSIGYGDVSFMEGGRIHRPADGERAIPIQLLANRPPPGTSSPGTFFQVTNGFSSTNPRLYRIAVFQLQSASAAGGCAELQRNAAIRDGQYSDAKGGLRWPEGIPPDRRVSRQRGSQSVHA